MYGELASVKQVVDLTSDEALDKAEVFLIGLGYDVSLRSPISLTARRSGTSATLTVNAKPEESGGVRIRVVGNDVSGMDAQRAHWAEWSANLPKRGGESVELQRIATATLPAQQPEVQSPATQPSVQPPPSDVWRGAKLTFGGCLVLGFMGFVGLAAVVILVIALAAGMSDQTTAGGYQEVNSVVFRVSGSPGLRYTGSYGAAGGGTSVDGEIGMSQNVYEVPVEDGVLDFDVATGLFTKLDQEGTLQVDLLVNGQVVQSQQTSAQFGTVDVSYSPQTDY